MSVKPRMVLVAGEWDQPRMLKVFETLSESWDIVICAFDRPGIVERASTCLQLKLYPTIEDMPGYMRGLDADVARADVVVGFESSRLASFQALRASLKEGIPFFCLITESLPFFYADFPNIRAIQEDIFRHSAGFLCPTERSREMLLTEGVDTNRIFTCTLRPDTERFKIQYAARERFRSYIQIPIDCNVALFHGALIKDHQPHEALKAMDFLRRTSPAVFSGTKLIFAGIGSEAESLKYRCVDTKLGKNVLFLHQDPEPFISDLYNASDVLIVPPQVYSDGVVPRHCFPMTTLEAMSTGIVPLCLRGSLAHDLVHKISPNGGEVVDAFAYQDLGRALAKVFGGDIHQRKDHIHKDVRDEKNILDTVGDLFGIVRANLASNPRNSRRQHIRDLVAEVDALSHKGKDPDVLVKVEDIILRGVEEPTSLARLKTLKGDALMNLGRMEDAMNAYSDAVQVDEHSLEAYRGLGFLAWAGHSHDEALAFFKKALTISEDDSKVLLGLGLTYRRLLLYDEAVYWLERAISHDDVRSKATTAIAQVCLEVPRSDRAMILLKRTIENIGETPQLLMALGKLHMNLGNNEEGAALVSRALAG